MDNDFLKRIKVEDNTEKDYESYKKARNQRELDKEIWKFLKKREEEQKKILEDNQDELRY